MFLSVKKFNMGGVKPVSMLMSTMIGSLLY
jgi:hypothetical protein